MTIEESGEYERLMNAIDDINETLRWRDITDEHRLLLNTNRDVMKKRLEWLLGAYGDSLDADTPIDHLKAAVTALESRVAQIEGMLRPTEVSAKENDWGVKLEKKTL